MLLSTAASSRFSEFWAKPHADNQACQCAWCATEQPFEMPQQVADACILGDLVIFAGAGISTEGRTVLPFTLYDHISAELDLSEEDDRSFPSVMSAYEASRGRIALLREIKDRLDYVRSFPNIDNQASLFHQELSGIPTVRDIVTTNWDDYFERDCGAQPFVTDKDWAFSSTNERKVFKLHGSLLNPGSIVATEHDYKRCYRNLNQGLMGGKLKELLATKVVVFVGYSLRDRDFERVYRMIKRRMGEILPRSYIVTPDSAEPPRYAQDMHIINTGGVHFLRGLKNAFPNGELVADDRFTTVPALRSLVRTLHHDLLDRGEMREDPAMLMCACYHDGLLDALSHISANKPKGRYSHRCYVRGVVDGPYEALREERFADGRWLSVAYIDGYVAGLTFLIDEDEDRNKMSLYYVMGARRGTQMQTYDQYEEVAQEFRRLSPAAYEYAERQAGRLAPGAVHQHYPILL